MHSTKTKKEARLSYKWSCNQDRFTCEKAAANNLRFLLFGLESASQTTLDKLIKGNKVEEILPSCKAASDAGLSPHITVMLGYPWETEEDIPERLEKRIKATID